MQTHAIWNLVFPVNLRCGACQRRLWLKYVAMELIYHYSILRYKGYTLAILLHPVRSLFAYEDVYIVQGNTIARRGHLLYTAVFDVSSVAMLLKHSNVLDKGASFSGSSIWHRRTRIWHLTRWASIHGSEQMTVVLIKTLSADAPTVPITAESGKSSSQHLNLWIFVSKFLVRFDPWPVQRLFAIMNMTFFKL